jgi:hypothetical protein
MHAGALVECGWSQKFTAVRPERNCCWKTILTTFRKEAA